MADELVYVSWGGTGRGVTLAAALAIAIEKGKGLLYLAILDDAHFADLDDAFLAVVRDELDWLLDAQLELTRSQAGADDTPVRVLIRGGDVVEEVADVVTTMGESEVLVGAPEPLSGHEAVDAMVEQLRARLQVPVSLIGGSADGALLDHNNDVAAAD